MKKIDCLPQLFHIRDELLLENSDRFFEEVGYHKITKEKTIISYLKVCKGEMTWFDLRISDRKILNATFRTMGAIDIPALLIQARTKYNFGKEEVDKDLIILKRDRLHLHVRVTDYAFEGAHWYNSSHHTF